METRTDAPQDSAPQQAPQSSDATKDAVNKMATELGNQALDVLDAAIASEALQTRLKASVAPIVSGLVDGALEERSQLNEKLHSLLKPYTSSASYALMGGAAFAIIVLLMLCFALIMLSSVRSRALTSK